jgi:cytochrome P450
LLPSAVEELRGFSVADGLLRVATTDIKVPEAGAPAQRGKRVIFAMSLANQAPAVHGPDADLLDWHRADHRHLVFGHGVHERRSQNLA